jgi:hypothetical protein
MNKYHKELPTSTRACTKHRNRAAENTYALFVGCSLMICRGRRTSVRATVGVADGAVAPSIPLRKMYRYARKCYDCSVGCFYIDFVTVSFLSFRFESYAL